MLSTLVAPLPVPMAVAIYFILWWITLFAVLPFGVRSQSEASTRAPGTDPGAPITPRIGLKALVTTLVSAVLFAALLIYLKNAE